MTAHLKLPVLVAILLTLVVVSVVVLSGNRRTPIPGPPPMTAAEIAALPDTQLIQRVTDDLRWKVADVAPHLERWRLIGEPARHVLSLSWIDQSCGPAIPVGYDGFSGLLKNQAANMASLEDMALAYEAIGSPQLARVVRDARLLADKLTETSHASETMGNPFESLDRSFVKLLNKEHAESLLRQYIRSHAEDIATASIPN